MTMKPFVGGLIVVAVTTVFLADNAVWFGMRPKYEAQATYGVFLNHTRSDILAELNKSEYAGGLVVSGDEEVGYLATVYTPLRSWYSHEFNTPYAEQRRGEVTAFFQRGMSRRTGMEE